MQPLSWYLNRLKLMSVPEMTWRGAQAAQRLRYLRSQAGVPAPDRPGASLRPWPRPVGVEAGDYVAAADRIVAGRIPVFGVTAVIDGGGAFWCGDGHVDWVDDATQQISRAEVRSVATSARSVAPRRGP